MLQIAGRLIISLGDALQGHKKEIYNFQLTSSVNLLILLVERRLLWKFAFWNVIKIKKVESR